MPNGHCAVPVLLEIGREPVAVEDLLAREEELGVEAGLRGGLRFGKGGVPAHAGC